MKRLSIIIISVLVSIFIHSQNLLEEEFSAYISEYEKFNFDSLKNHRFKNSLYDLPKYLSNYCEKKVSRDLDFNIEESIYVIYLAFSGADGFLESLKYNLHVLRQENIVIGIICNDAYRNKSKTYFNNDKINTYISKHDSLYHTKTTSKDLINDLTKKVVYGYLCGNVPVLRDIPERKGYKFNDYKNIDIFRQWLRSYNPEEQSYGADAIGYIYKKPNILIGEKENEIGKLDKNLRKHIKERNSIINTCSGCSVGIYKKVY